MPGSYNANNPLGDDEVRKLADAAVHDDQMDDEEKVIANRPDANMPALLTRDVLGG